MKSLRVGINGFGRIGRLVFRAGLNEKGIDFVAVNDHTDTKTSSHLLKYDSIHGILPNKVTSRGNNIIVDGKEIKVFNESDPLKLPWGRHDIDIVIESTGVFRDREGASKHLKSGAKKVLISAPGKSPDVTIVMGVNDSDYKKEHKIISLASCTTNCLAPVAKVLNENFGIVKGFMTTVHAYTNDQAILDSGHKDMRRTRAAMMSIIPTTTGATKSVIEAMPELKGKLNGLAMRVPVPDGSIVDLVAELKKDTIPEKVNSAFKKASQGKLKGIIEYTEVPIVSVDVIGNTHSAIIDGLSTQAMGNLVKVLAWYDNEMGYSYRMIDALRMISKKGL